MLRKRLYLLENKKYNCKNLTNKAYNYNTRTSGNGKPLKVVA